MYEKLKYIPFNGMTMNMRKSKKENSFDKKKKKQMKADKEIGDMTEMAFYAPE